MRGMQHSKLQQHAASPNFIVPRGDEHEHGPVHEQAFSLHTGTVR